MQEAQKPKKKSRKKLWIILAISAVIIIPLLIGLFIIGLYFYNEYSTLSGDYNYDNSYYKSSSEEGLGSLNSLGDTPGESSSSMPGVLEEESTISRSESINDTAADTSSASDELTEQKVIKTGYLTLQVKKADEGVAELTNIASSKGGFILSSSLYTASDETKSGTVTLKVPVSKYEETLSEIKNLGDVQRETSSGQDVTEQYADLQAQLKNYKAEEEQYLKILERADTVDDILKVTKQLSAVRENIEVIEGRIKYLESQTDMSTITVSLSEETSIDVPTKEWKPLETLKKAFRTWIKFLQGLVDIGIWLVIFLGPLTLLVYVIVKMIVRRVRKKKAKKLE